MGHSGRQERTADVTGYHARGQAPVDEVEPRDQFEIYIAKNGAVGVRDNVTGAFVQWFTGDDALMDATSWAGRCNRGEVPAPSRIQEGDLVVIHTGTKRYEVVRVELDSMRSGERLDFALLDPVDSMDPRTPFWQSCDLLHVVERRSGLTGSLIVRLEEEVREIRP
jgi:hypothetical protein